MSVDSYSLGAHLNNIKNKKKTAEVLSKYFQIPQPVVYKKLNKNTEFIWIKRQITDKQAYDIKNFQLSGVVLQKELMRIYPNGRLASNVIEADVKMMIDILKKLNYNFNL